MEMREEKMNDLRKRREEPTSGKEWRMERNNSNERNFGECEETCRC